LVFYWYILEVYCAAWISIILVDRKKIAENNKGEQLQSCHGNGPFYLLPLLLIWTPRSLFQCRINWFIYDLRGRPKSMVRRTNNLVSTERSNEQNAIIPRSAKREYFHSCGVGRLSRLFTCWVSKDQLIKKVVVVLCPPDACLQVPK
jgi:hypothetical protein